MKLLYCDRCGDLFNLNYRVKSCYCGHVKGHYINNEEAEVNGNGFSIAIGNGSLMGALVESTQTKEDFRRGKNIDQLYERQPNSILCWARPHEGPANPHTKINKEL